MPAASAAEIITRLDLAPHPEGGHFRETFRDAAGTGGRGHSTAIYYLLQAGEISAWHRVDAVEIWHHYAGAPLRLSIAPDRQNATSYLLGADIAAGQVPQIAVPATAWQMALSCGAWTLVGCTVAPAFRFEGFELAPPGFQPPSAG